MWRAANSSRSSPKTWHVNKRDFFQLSCLGSEQWIWSRCCDADFNSASGSLLCCLSNCPLKRDFLDIYLTTFLESVISEIQKLWGSSLFSKCQKLIQISKIQQKIEKNVFVSKIVASALVSLHVSIKNSILAITANVLTSSPKIWLLNKRDFFQLNFLGRDQWIW